MRAGAIAVGAIIFVLGIGVVVWANTQAENMGLLRYMYPDQYASYTRMALAGYVGAALGIGVGLYGLASSPQQTVQIAKTPVIQFSSDRASFCAYCGTPLQGAIVCRVCGRSVQK